MFDFGGFGNDYSWSVAAVEQRPVSAIWDGQQ